AGIIIALALFQRPVPPPDKVVAQNITIVVRHRPTPPPTPPPATPTPRPTPQVTPTPRIALTTRHYNAAQPKAAATPAEHQGGAAAPHHLIVAKRPVHLVPVTPAPQRVAVSSNSSLQNGNAAGQANGGAGTGGGPGTGNGGAGGTGSGTGGNGTSAGEDVPLTPCGAVYFDPIRSQQNSDGSEYVQVRMRVQLNNGQELSDVLHWFFYYKTKGDDPFANPHEERAPMQFPPKSYNVGANQEPVTAFVLKHTRPNGYTSLPDCPPQTSSSS
ncbi:MAG: hypothetical protein JO043_10480, partial [Candidatus Eremiobacteraeota bacterium]|nr:hypothetical protein [Candidatus Eremiobacteraeota bacterium]